MLVLTRKPGETVMIGRNIGIKVVEIRGDRVKLGVDCPQEIPILRDELCPHPPVDQMPKADAKASQYYPEFA